MIAAKASIVHSADLPFDIAITFDDLQAWKGTRSGDVFLASDMPKKLDNSPGIIGYYSKWGTTTGPGNWIDDFGSGTHIGQNGKSAKIDLGNHDGPSRQSGYCCRMSRNTL